MDEEELALHAHIAGKQPPVDCRQALQWLHRLGDANEKVKLFEKKPFRQILLRMFITTAAYNHYTVSQKFQGAISFGFFEMTKFALRMCKNFMSDAWHWARTKRLLKRWRIDY